MAGYIGTKSVNLSTTGADIKGNVTVSGTTFTLDSATVQTVDLGDNDRIRLGDSDDLQIYYSSSSSDSHITASGNLTLDPTGSLELAGNTNVTGTLTSDGLTVDTNTLHVDATNNRVGIGTSSPSSLLTLHGSQPIITLSDPDTGSTSTISGNSGHLILNADSGSDASNNTIDFQVDNSQKMRLDASGHMLINNTAYSANGTLVVQQTADSKGIAIIDSAAANTFFLENDGTINKIRNNATVPIAFEVSNTERMRITSAGNVGIATDSPSTRLTVGAGVTSEEIRVDAGAGWADLTLNSNSTNGGHIYFNDGSNAGEIFYYHVSDYMAFNTAGSERMRIDASGSVGIGKVPTASLDVLAPSNQEPLILTVTSNGYGYATFKNAAGNDVGYWGLGSGLVPSGSSEDFALRAQRNDLVFCAGGGTERMRISSAGLVGINTNSPASYYAQKLVVDCGSDVQNGITIVSGTSNSGMFAFADGTSGDQRYRGYLNYNHSNDTLKIGTAGAERIIIEPNAVRFATDEVTPTGSGKDLGSPTYQWRDIYMSGSIEIENGTGNVGVGKQALNSNTATATTAVGYQALYTQSTAQGGSNTAVGYQAGYTGNGYYNSLFGYKAGESLTGYRSTFIGHGSGSAIGSGSKNTIIGTYNGNEGGLDIRTSDNNIVLSDGDGNPRGRFDANGKFYVKTGNDQGIEVRIGSTTDTNGKAIDFVDGDDNNCGTIRINASANTVTYNTSSDHRLKENVVELTGATTRLKQLEAKRFNFISDPDDITVDGFLAHEVQTVVPEAITGTHNEVDEDSNPVYQQIDQSKLVPLLTAALQEALDEITDLKARVAILEAN